MAKSYFYTDKDGKLKKYRNCCMCQKQFTEKEENNGEVINRGTSNNPLYYCNSCEDIAFASLAHTSGREKVGIITPEERELRRTEYAKDLEAKRNSKKTAMEIEITKEFHERILTPIPDGKCLHFILLEGADGKYLSSFNDSTVEEHVNLINSGGGYHIRKNSIPAKLMYARKVSKEDQKDLDKVIKHMTKPRKQLLHINYVRTLKEMENGKGNQVQDTESVSHGREPEGTERTSDSEMGREGQAEAGV